MVGLLAVLTFAVSPKPVPMPGGAPGIGFDDLRWAPQLGRLLVPAGRTGALDLLDPASMQLAQVVGFSAQPSWSGGHDESVTSADEGAGLLFATDRTTHTVSSIDPAARKILAQAKLAGGPDYVRFVAPTHEVWVTEPDQEQIEVFTLGEHGALAHAAVISVKGGPESLAVDPRRGRALAHLWKGATVAIDLQGRKVVAHWANGCGGSRGIALDQARNWIFAGCAEGKAVLLDGATGKVLSSAATGAGVDIIDYAPALHHLYVPGGRSGTLTILAVDAKGTLSLLATEPAAEGSHCAATDGQGRVFVCDPRRGRLLMYLDEGR